MELLPRNDLNVQLSVSPVTCTAVTAVSPLDPSTASLH